MSMFSSGRSRTAVRIAGAMSRLVTTMHALRRNQRLQAADGVFEQRIARDQREQRLWTLRRGERPEARTDAAGEHDRPEREARDVLADGRELGLLQRPAGGPARSLRRIEVTLSRVEIHRSLKIAFIPASCPL